MGNDDIKTQPQVEPSVEKTDSDTEGKLRDDLNKALGKVEVLQNQTLQQAAQVQPAPQPEVKTPTEVAPYPQADLAESNPGEYNKQARNYLDNTVSRKVEEIVGAKTVQDGLVKEVADTQAYINKKYNAELQKGIESPVVLEATKLYQEAGYNYPTNSPEYFKAQKSVLDQAAATIAEKELADFKSKGDAESTRKEAADDSTPDQSTAQRQNTNLPDLSDDESKYNQSWGLDQKKLQEAKARLEYVK